MMMMMIHLSCVSSSSASTFFKPFNVSYDHRAIIIDGNRRMLISAGIHYPRATPEMWPDLIAKSKEGGADVIETYVFWNAHESIRGQYNFKGKNDIVKFVKLVGSSGLYLQLRIGPYEEMQRFVKKIVDLMREEMLFSWQGGPIIMLQIENEYGNMESSYGQQGKDYVKWAASMALGLGAGVPWIDACNGYYCDGYKPNSYNKPTLWTENWDGWYTTWGGRLPHRPVEDLAFAVARFFQRGGSFMNYYMLVKGFVVTTVDLHAAIKLCEPALVAADSAQYIKLGQNQEAHVYRANVLSEGPNSNRYGSQSNCSAFLANIDEHKAASVTFLGQSYTLPPWSVSSQTSIKTVEFSLPLSPNISVPQQSMIESKLSSTSKSWMTVKEPIGVWSENNFTVQGILEHLNVTKDYSDYLWHITKIYVSDDDISFWKTNEVRPTVTIDSMRDVLRVFINGQLTGSVIGHWVKVVQPVEFQSGYNDLILLSQTVGLQNYGAFLEKDGAGFRGQVKLTGFKNGDIDLSKILWTYQVGLKGEFQQIYGIEENEAEWTDLTRDGIPSTFTWYKTYFDAPDGIDPVALDLGSMGKGQAWVNGHHIGRYWTVVAPKGGCQDTCDYRGAYNSDKCTTNCGNPTQTWYHVPRSWLQASNNLLVIFEETGGNPFEISVKLRSTRIVCEQVSESHYPPVRKWSNSYSVDGKLSINKMAPEMHLHCQDGYIISSIEFASYGTPQGRCQKFSRGNCHAPMSLSVVSEACQGKSSCSIGITNAVFGGDPCRGIVKTLAVEARCIPSSSTGFSQI
ncbi:Beta-galactosidase 9 [Citrus sinensis]|nr:Beta-galactosidase 9 [Citrus sinensis]